MIQCVRCLEYENIKPVADQIDDEGNIYSYFEGFYFCLKCGYRIYYKEKEAA